MPVAPQQPGPVRIFHAVVGIQRASAGQDVRLLRVHAVLGETALAAQDAVARALLGAQHVHPQVAGHPGTVPQDHEDVVVRLGSGPPGRQFRMRERGRPKKLHGLVQQVGAEVKQHPAAVVRRCGRLPCFGDVGRPPLEAGLKAAHGAEGSGVHEGLHGEEVAVPAPVLEHREHPAQPPGQVDELLPLGAADSEGLVDDDVEAGFQRRFREWIVGGGRRAEHQQVQFAGELQDIGRGVDDPGRRIAVCGRRSPAGVRSGNDIERIGRVCGDERGVEDAARKAETGDGGADGPG